MRHDQTYPVWAPDDSSILFQSSHAGDQYDLWSMKVDWSDLDAWTDRTQLTDTADFREDGVSVRIPEPVTLTMLGLGGLVICGRKRD